MTWNFIARHNFDFTYFSDSSENQLILHVLALRNSLTIILVLIRFKIKLLLLLVLRNFQVEKTFLQL